jgi:hypothetical protein
VQCLVCGCADVRTDEVVRDEVIFLAECPRCDYRWTARVPGAHYAPAPGARPRVVALRRTTRTVPEPATAA